MMSPPGKPAKDRSWKAAKGMMGNVGTFLDQLVNFDKEHVDPTNLAALSEYLNDPEFNPEFIKTKSQAAAGLCGWVVNAVRYYIVYCDVEPKRLALETANAQLADAQSKLADIQNKIADLNKNLQDLRSKYEKGLFYCPDSAD
jgi:dynein heavy chain